MTEVILRTKDLKVYFPIRSGIFLRTTGWVHAVDSVDLSVEKGETMGLVGESGCGKTTLGETVLGIIKPTSGEIFFEERNLSRLKKGDMLKLRRRMQIVFQDPLSSLNPYMVVSNIIGEPLKVHGVSKGNELKATVSDLLEEVGLQPDQMERYPHELSGGQKQRVSIARALALHPDFLVLDEPTSSLDVSVQAQIVNLIKNLQRKHNLTYLFISHDLNLVSYLSDRISVMYLGKIVELAKTDELFESPQHPYVHALISANPIPNPRLRHEHIVLKGSIPSPSNPPSGCRFHTRCPRKVGKICEEEEPRLLPFGNGHYVACHHMK